MMRLSPATLTNSYFRALSEIFRDIAQVFFASVVVNPLVSGLDKLNWFSVILGMINSIVFWYLSLMFAERGKL